MSPTMRAVLIKDGKGPIENLYIGEVAKPSPKPDQIIVKIKAFGLNHMDLIQREGNYPPPPGASEILGVEFSGHVHELGSDVTHHGFNVGDEVLGLAGGGAYAEYIAVSAKLLIKKPAHLSFVEAASIPENFFTAFKALSLVCEIKAGDDVLVHAGASGVGVATIQIARYLGAKTVTATASTKEKLDWLLSLPNGATHVANYKTEDFSQVVKSDQVTGSKGVDVLVDFVGQTHWKKNIESLAIDGRMVVLAVMSGRIVPEVDILPILSKRLRIQGSTLRSRSLEFQAKLVERFKNEILIHITGKEGAGPIRTMIHAVYPWTEIQKATHEMANNANCGKIIAEIA